MKCKFCGAEIREGSNVCEYCDSAVERPETQTHTVIINRENPSKGIISVIGKIVIALACIAAVSIIVLMSVVLNSEAIKNPREYMSGTRTVYEIPGNETCLTGRIIQYDADGVISLEYDNHIYEEVRIKDKQLVAWLADTGRSIDAVEICFATDNEGNIRELGLASSDFFVISGEDSRYTAVRNGSFISFSSAMQLEPGCCYGGYFSYPEMNLYLGEERQVLSMAYMDLKCDDKECMTAQDYYTGEDITVYRILVGREWYYCCEETYDMIQEGDSLDEYSLCTNQELSYIHK